MSDLVQKSFRLPVEIVDFIESQEGKNLSDKLIRVLEKYIAEEHDLNKLLADQSDQLAFWHDFARALLNQEITLNDFLSQYGALLEFYTKQPTPT